MQVEREKLTLEQMRAQRTISQVAFKKFTEIYKKIPQYAFCFYEGEDAKYYNSRIDTIWGHEIYTIVAGNKKAVIQTMSKIKSDPLYEDICTMFFVDRDFDESIAGTNDDLFETPCYSIENLFACESTLSNVLKSEFGLNECDDDFQKCMENYKRLLEEYNDIIYKFNALVAYQHTFAPNKSGNFSNVKLSQIARITLEKVDKSSKFDDMVSDFNLKFQVDVTKMEQLEFELRKAGNPELVLRGKNQLDFMCKFISLLREANDHSTNDVPSYFSVKLSRVYIDLTTNRLSQLSQYARTPIELKNFLMAHRRPKST